MMPNMLNAIRRFEDTIQFQIVKKTVDDGDLAETSQTQPAGVPTLFEGQLQPLHPRELAVKPEGQRHFKWWTLYTDMQLSTDWIIIDEQRLEYRVMNVTDWRAADFFTYQLIQGPGL